MSVVGILPAGGKSERWGGYPKWMLPIGPELWAMDSAIRALNQAGIDRLIVVVRPGWVDIIAAHLKSRQLPWVSFLYEEGDDPDIWAAIKLTLPHAGDVNLLAMPDTLIEPDAFAQVRKRDVFRWGLGLF